MMKTIYSLFLGVFCIIQIQAQERFYATTPLDDAKEIKTKFPNQVTILDSYNGEAAIYITKFAAEELHHNVVVHGPGYVFEPSAKSAIATIRRPAQKKGFVAASYTINQESYVNTLLGKVSATNVKNHIQQLENYGTRYHTKQQAKNAANDLKAKWEGLKGTRSDISVRLFQHQNTNMPSVILTIKGSETPNEYVVLGGHLDSTSPNKDVAPGADDNASGIATITEVIRILIASDFKPKKTVEFMAFSAEEVGLVGSKEIAKDYKNKNINIIGMLQLDMTNYRGTSSGDMSISNDSYVSSELNQFLKDLIGTYNASGTHKITYTQTKCNYGCSDHYSFSQQGYRAAFPFEAKFNESNPNIHRTNDVLSNSDPTAVHASRFVKLGLEYIVEAAKHNGATGGDTQAPTVPTGLTASGVTQTNVSLNWNASSDNVGVAGYTVYRNGANIGITTTNSYQVTGLSPDTQYSFTVKAYDASGNSSEESNTVSVKTAPKPPCEGTFVLTLKTDRYPEDISWAVKNDANGTTVLSGSDYTNKEYTYNIEDCLPDGCYTFEIKDSYKDGICCQYGNGSYTLTIDGNEVSKGGDYKSSASAKFCVGEDSNDTQAPSVPNNLSASNITETGVVLSWAASTDNVAVISYEVFNGNTSVGSTSNTQFPVSGLSANTTYNFTVVAKDAAGNTSAKSTVLTVKTKVATVSYCMLKGNNTTYEWIDYVGLNGMTNASGADSGYKDYTAKVAQVSYGSNSITLSSGFQGSAYKENWFVWIDFDKDGTFSDDERVVNGSSSTAGNYEQSFTVPSTVSTGNTRMRVAMVYNATSQACGNFSYGEVEDYTVNIQASTISLRSTVSREVAKRLNPISIVNDFIVFPNPVKSGQVTIHSTRLQKGNYSVYDMSGALKSQGTFEGRLFSVAIDSLSSGKYLITIFNGEDSYTTNLIVR